MHRKNKQCTPDHHNPNENPVIFELSVGLTPSQLTPPVSLQPPVNLYPQSTDNPQSAKALSQLKALGQYKS